MEYTLDFDLTESYVANATTQSPLFNETEWQMMQNNNGTDPTAFGQAIHYLNQIGIPLVVLFGGVGNTLSLVVFVKSHLRYQSSSVYLAFLNVVDTGFLLNLFVTWFSWLEIRLFHRQGWCQLVIYFSFVFAFLSVWTVVAFTVERFLVVYRPLKRQQWCTRKRAKVVLMSLTAFSLLFYSFPFWCAEVRYDQNGSKCVFKHQYYMFLMIMTFMDTLITLVLPSLAILILNGGITYKIVYFFSGHFHVATETTSCDAHCSSSSSSKNIPPLRWPPTVAPNNSENNSAGSRDCEASKSRHSSIPEVPRAPVPEMLDERKRVTVLSRSVSRNRRSESERSFVDHSGQQHRRMCQIRTTRTLLIVSTVFLVLNLPSHAFRVYHIIAGLIDPRLTAGGHHIILWQQLLQLVYYVNFAINFVLYIACSRSFRTALHRLCRRSANNIRSQAKTTRERLRNCCDINKHPMSNRNGIVMQKVLKGRV